VIVEKAYVKEGQHAVELIVFAQSCSSIRSRPQIQAAEIEGTYDLIDHRVNLRGTLHTSGKLADTTKDFESVVLKALVPFFKKKSVTVVPFVITGTSSDPSFALDLTAKR
jgi:hypothetical protein